MTNDKRYMLSERVMKQLDAAHGLITKAEEEMREICEDDEIKVRKVMYSDAETLFDTIRALRVELDDILPYAEMFYDNARVQL